MKLEDICVSLEIAKRLKAKGFPQENTLLYWNEVWKDNGNEKDYKETIAAFLKHNKYFGIDKNDNIIDYYSAPSAEELLKELPSGIQVLYVSNTEKNTYIYQVNNFLCDYSKDHRRAETDLIKLCNALAKMWLYLKDNKLIK